MKTNIIRSAALFLVLSTFLIGTADAEQKSSPVDVYYPSMHFIFDRSELVPSDGQKGFIYEGSTYVPLRFVAYALNYSVQWDNDTYTVSLSKPTGQDKQLIDEYRINHLIRDATSGKKDNQHLTPEQIDVYFEQVSYRFQGETKQPSSGLPSGFIYEDTLYVPMRFISEMVGQKIEWDQESYSVISTTADNSKQEKVVPESAPSAQSAADPSPQMAPSPSGLTAPSSSPSIAGGSGGSTTKPTYDSIISRANSQISDLKNRASGQLTNMAVQYISSQDAQVKTNIKQQAGSALDRYDAEFSGIMDTLEGQLRSNGYDTSITGTYRQEYASQKAAARKALGN